MAGNPYLQDQANAITQQANNNLFNYQMPQINSGAIAAGGFGGSRQGVAQGLAIGQTNQGISNAIAGLQGNAWESDQNRAQQMAMQNNQLTQQQRQFDTSSQLQRDQMMGNFGLGLGQLDLQSQVAGWNNQNTNRQLDLSQYGLGAQLTNQGNLGLGSLGGQLYQNGYQQQQAPYQALGQYAGLLSPFSGLNGSTSQTTPGASTVGSAMGGALTAAQLWQLLSGGKP